MITSYQMKDKMKTKVIIDGSNQWYRAYCATHLDPPGGPVSIMTYMLRRICREYGINNVVVCWDAGDGGRKALDPTYKAQRKSVPGVWEDIVYMKAMVDALGIPNAHKKGYEADDVCGTLAAQADKAMILSYDKDFYQLVSDKVSVLRPERTVRGNKIPQKVVDRDIVLEEFGCEPQKLKLLKAFTGDSSDNIPKVPIRMTKKFKEPFFKIINKVTTINEFYSLISLFDEKYHADLQAFRPRAELNHKLVTIQTDIDVRIENPVLDGHQFERLCEEMEITRLKLDDWTNIPKEPAPPAPTQNSLF
jgi:DNA polymerase-1